MRKLSKVVRTGGLALAALVLAAAPVLADNAGRSNSSGSGATGADQRHKGGEAERGTSGTSMDDRNNSFQGGSGSSGHSETLDPAKSESKRSDSSTRR